MVRVPNTAASLPLNILVDLNIMLIFFFQGGGGLVDKLMYKFGYIFFPIFFLNVKM